MKIRTVTENGQIKLTREQSQAIGLLSLGTFLEYFDLMIYLHMAVLLNELFFPPTDQFTYSLLTAFSLCSTYFFRPFGVLVFGWIGDNIGRKATIVITTMLMAIACIVVATLPTYAEIGISASWIITICRIMQGIASLGERVGAEIYITELTKPPIQYSAVSLISCLASLGAIAALGVSSFGMTYQLNWRTAFWIGAIIALVGTAARTALRETVDFVDAKRRIINTALAVGLSPTDIVKDLNKNFMPRIKIDKKTVTALILIFCAWPVWFYLAYGECANILKNSFNFTAQQIINQNFYVALVQFFGNLILVFLCYIMNPLTILKIKAYIFLPFLLILPYLLNNATSPLEIFLLQSIIISGPSGIPGMAIFIKYFPTLRRFVITSFSYAVSRALMYAITSVGLVYGIEYLGLWSISIITIPVIFGYIYGIRHFVMLTSTKKDKVFWKKSVMFT